MGRLPVATLMVALTATIILGATGCGGERQRRDPMTVPTITPTVVTPPAGQGEFLTPLSAGQSVVPDDGRYTFLVPTGWYSIDAEIAEEFWVQPPPAGASPQVTVNVVRESVDGIENPRQYAEIGRQHGEDIYPDVVTLSSGPVVVGDRPAWRWVFTSSVGSGGSLFYQLFILDGRQGFVMTGAAPSDADPTRVQALFDGIAGSLTFVRG